MARTTCFTFQSTPARERATVGTVEVEIEMMFQSTPARERATADLLIGAVWDEFQSTPARERATFRRPVSGRVSSVSIHARP